MRAKTVKTELTRSGGMIIACLVAVLLMVVSAANAEYTILRQSINRGGMTAATAGPYTMKTTVGQNGRGKSTAGTHLLKGGFWYAVGGGGPVIFTELILPHDTVCANADTIKVPIIVRNFTDVMALQFRIEFDPAVIVPTGDTLFSKYLVGMMVGGTSVRLSINWEGITTPKTVPDDDTLMCLLFDQLVCHVI